MPDWPSPLQQNSRLYLEPQAKPDWEIIVGIDVSKDRLDVHVLPCGETFSVENDHAGVEDLVRRLAALSPAVVAALAGAGLAIVVVNPARV